MVRRVRGREEEMKEIMPTKRRVMIEKVNLEPLKKSVIITPSKFDPWIHQRTARVLRIGPDCTEVQPGQIVVLGRECGVVEHWIDKNEMLVEEKEIVSVVDAEGFEVLKWSKKKTLKDMGI